MFMQQEYMCIAWLESAKETLIISHECVAADDATLSLCGKFHGEPVEGYVRGSYQPERTIQDPRRPATPSTKESLGDKPETHPHSLQWLVSISQVPVWHCIRSNLQDVENYGHDCVFDQNTDERGLPHLQSSSSACQTTVKTAYKHLHSTYPEGNAVCL